MRKARHYLISEACQELKMEQQFIIHCIRAHWIHPFSPETMEFDEEDIARLGLIRELKEDFGVNEEAVPVILHLLDQIYFIHRQIQKLRNQLEENKAQRSA